MARRLAAVGLLLSTACAPSSPPAGSLTEQSLPNAWLGFERVIDSSDEAKLGADEPSRKQDHDPALIAQEVVPLCSTTRKVSPLPTPLAVLTASYRDSQQAPGSAVVLEFRTSVEAITWFDGYRTALDECRASTSGPFTITDVDSGDTLVVDVRNYHGTTWSERVDVNGTVVRLLMAQTRETLDNLRVSP